MHCRISGTGEQAEKTGWTMACSGSDTSEMIFVCKCWMDERIWLLFELLQAEVS